MGDSIVQCLKTKILGITNNQQQLSRSVTLQSTDAPVDVVEEFQYFSRKFVTSFCQLDREID